MATRHPNATAAMAGLRKASASRWLETEIPGRNQLLASINCPFPLRINPHLDAAESSSLRWLERLGLMPTPEHRTRVSNAHLSKLVAGFYPTAEPAALELASDYVCWAFALDDIGDETEVGARPARLLELFARFELVLRGGSLTGSATALDRGLEDVIQRAAEFTNEGQLAEFVEGNLAYFGGMLWEANNRAHHHVPEESAYLTFRPAAGAVPSFFSLIEPLENVPLSPRVRADAAVQSQTRLAGNIICWINDVLSYEKERAHGDFHNLVMVYEHHRRLPPGIAAMQAIAQINSAMAEFSAGAERLPHFGRSEDEALQRYLDTLRSVIRITLAWTYDSTRYHEVAPPSSR